MTNPNPAKFLHCPHCAGPLSKDMETSGWNVPPLIRDSFSMIGSAVGGTASAFYGFNFEMSKQKVLGKRSYGLEPGEIDPAPIATKTQRVEDPPHPSVANSSHPPVELTGHAARKQPGEREVYARRLSPTSREQTKKLKRSGGYYSGSKLASLCLGSMHHSSVAVPRIMNFPKPRMGVMLSEDNALAASQAVATSQQADLDHYVDSEGSHLKDWIFRDLKVNLSRSMVAVEAAERMFFDKDRESFNRFRSIHDLEEKEKECQAEIKVLRDRIDHEREKSRKDREKLKEVEVELATERFRNECFESELKDTKEKLAAAEEKLNETVDLEKIQSTYFDEWLSEWADTQEGEDWLHDVSRSARAMAFWEALQIAKAHHPEVDAVYLQTKLKGCDDIGVNEKGEAFLLSEAVDPAGAFTFATNADAIRLALTEEVGTPDFANFFSVEEATRVGAAVSTTVANDPTILAKTNARFNSAGFDNVGSVAVSDLLPEEDKVDIPERIEGDDGDDDVDVGVET